MDRDGNVLGTHKGIEHYTIGQRKGLNLPGKNPYYVYEIKKDTNEVVLGDGDSVYSDTVYVKDASFMAVEDMKEPKELMGKIRYSHKGAECRVTPLGNGRLKCEFKEKQRAVTPGQALVLYEGDYIYGGGIIEKSSNR